MGAHPYYGLSPESYWKTGVEGQHPLTIKNLYKKRFEIRKSTRIATAGSCFAQHVAKHLKAHSFTVLDMEPAPYKMMPETAQAFGYGAFSARYGNIYVVRHLLQLIEDAANPDSAHVEVWRKEGRFYDALRPSIEPEGFPTLEEAVEHRQQHLKKVLEMLKWTDLFIFTLGLTEAWMSRVSGRVFPTAPGVIAGEFKDSEVTFVNFGFNEIYSDFVSVRKILKTFNPEMQFLLTVSPVPLTATSSKRHVLEASTYSKSVLRAVAGQLYQDYEDVDYFPSYELIGTHFSRAMFYRSNLRTVEDAGVEAVMRLFFSEHRLSEAGKVIMDKVDPHCEDALLEAFA